MNLVSQRWAVVLLAALIFCSVKAQGQGVARRGRSIQFSEPKVEVVTSNLNHAANSKKISLRNLDDQFKAPFNIMDSAEGMDAVPLAVPNMRPSAISTKSFKQIMDKKKEQEEWIFGSPEELEAQRLSAEKMFGVTEFDENGLEKDKDNPKSSIQKYWDRIDRERFGQTNRTGSDIISEKSDKEIKEQAKAMFGLAGLSSDSSDSSPSAYTSGKSTETSPLTSSLLQEVSPLRTPTDIFSTPAAPAPTLQQTEAAASRLNDFKQLFDMKSPSAGLSSPSAAFTRPSVADFSRPAASPWTPPASSASSLGTLRGSTFSSSSFGSPAASYNPPPVVNVQPARTIPQTGFQLPKRSF